MNNNIISFQAQKKWLSIQKEIRAKLEQNVWCVSCSDVVKILNYTVKDHQDTILLEGVCNRCGHKVVRVID